MVRYLRSVPICFLLFHLLPAQQREPRPEEELVEAEETERPEISLRRVGHADVQAKTRMFMWKVSDPTGLVMVDVKLLKIQPVSMKPTVLYRSEEVSGKVDLQEIG